MGALSCSAALLNAQCNQHKIQVQIYTHMNRKLAQAAPNSLQPSQFLDVVRNTFKYDILCSNFTSFG